MLAAGEGAGLTAEEYDPTLCFAQAMRPSPVQGNLDTFYQILPNVRRPPKAAVSKMLECLLSTFERGEEVWTALSCLSGLFAALPRPSDFIFLS